MIERKFLPPRVNEYLIYLSAVVDHSELTVDEYTRDLKIFFEYIAREKLFYDFNDEADVDLSFIDDNIISQITLNDILAFLANRNTVYKNSSATRARKASSLRGFFKFICDRMGYISNNPTSQLELSYSKRKLPKYLTLDQSLALLESIDGKDKIRDYCIITLFLNCGLRLAELVSLNLSSFDFTEKTLVVTGKGNKQRLLYLNKACVDAIKNYLEVRPVDGVKGDDRNALFLSRLKKRIGRQAVQQLVYKYLKKIGLDGDHYSVHKLRHTAATLMYQHGDVDVLVIKDMLGHENLSTTEIYTHVENKRLREAVKKNPLSNETADD